MKNNKPKYSQQEKIAFYAMKVAKARVILENYERNLERVMREGNQDWNSDLQKELNRKKRA